MHVCKWMPFVTVCLMRLNYKATGPTQVHRIQHGSPDVMLALVIGAVADPDRAGAVVTGKMMKLVLHQFALPADGVHHLQWALLTVVGSGHVSDEREEVVGLAVQAQRVETPQGEGGVTYPRVAVIPVAHAARSFRQRGGARGQQRTGRGIGEPLQRQRAAL